MTPVSGPATVAIIGTGLIGTSIALALREKGSTVWLADQDPAAARLAADLGAGDPLPAPGHGATADVAVIAVPPDAVADTLAAAQERGLARYYTDVASVKQLPVAQARDRGCDLVSYVPGHPLAGREKHGPAAARADLFLGRSWALCPTPETSEAATSTVTSLVRACGAVPVRTDAAAHDRWVALVSHAPHLVAAAMAARLEEAPAEALDLAGQGLRDVTRVAAGEVGLWTQTFSLISDILLFSGTHFGNRFEVLILPRTYSFELIKSGSQIQFGLENQFGLVKTVKGPAEKKGYSLLAGGYYATRLAALEYLTEIRKQASVFVLREITSHYWAPLGVWVVREGVRKTLKNSPQKFDSLTAAVTDLTGRVSTPKAEWLKKAIMLSDFRFQTTLDFF